MTALTSPSVRIVTFGDLEAGVWGFAWGGREQLAAAGRPDAAEALASATIAGDSPDEEWTLDSDAGTLTLAPVSEHLPESQPQAFDQLCRARGTLALTGDGEQQLDCLARRAIRPEPQAGELDSLRDFSAFFEPDRGLALAATRPRRAKGHEADIVTAVLFDSDGTRSVADPRLSTTYTADGEPTRVGLELWLEEIDDEQEEVYPRRAVGASLGPGTHQHVGQFTLHAYPFRCMSGGAEGAAVYLLARAT